MNNKLWATLTVDLDFIDAYRDPGSQEYKDLIGDIRESVSLYDKCVLLSLKTLNSIYNALVVYIYDLSFKF